MSKHDEIKRRVRAQLKGTRGIYLLSYSSTHGWFWNQLHRVKKRDAPRYVSYYSAQHPGRQVVASKREPQLPMECRA